MDARTAQQNEHAHNRTRQMQDWGHSRFGFRVIQGQHRIIGCGGVSDVKLLLQHIGRSLIGNLDLLLLGGGVMVIVFATRQATRDLDVVILSPPDRTQVRELAAAVANEKHSLIFGRNCMVSLEQIARAALDGEALALRSLTQDWLSSSTPLAEVACPSTCDPAILAVSAALTELFAQRTGQPAPAWTSIIAGLPEARFLVRSAATMKNLRRMCEEESPWPLKRRNLFAPADYLRFA